MLTKLSDLVLRESTIESHLWKKPQLIQELFIVSLFMQNPSTFLWKQSLYRLPNIWSHPQPVNKIMRKYDFKFLSIIPLFWRFTQIQTVQGGIQKKNYQHPFKTLHTFSQQTQLSVILQKCPTLSCCFVSTCH